MDLPARPDRRRLGLGAIAAGLSACASAPDPPPIIVDLARPDEPPASTTGLDAALRMTAQVMVNGQGPYDFVVDTGANRTVVSVELAQALALPAAGVADVHGVAGVEPAPTVSVARLTIDAVVASGLRAPTLPRARLGADGLLGVDVFRGRRVLMEFRRNRLTIGPSQSPGADLTSFDMRRGSTGVSSADLGERIVVPARYRFGQLIIVGADVAGRPVTAFVDTGAQSTVGNRALQNVVYGGRGAPRPLMFRVPILSATGQTSEAEVGVMPVLRIGGLTVTGMTTAFADLHVFDIWDLTRTPSLMLGMDVIRQFTAVELNYARREVAFYIPRPAGGPALGLR